MRIAFKIYVTIFFCLNLVVGFSQSFNYKGGKYCGKYKQAIFINGEKQNSSTDFSVELNNNAEKITVKLILSDLKLGFSPENNCSTQKKEKHADTYFLEVDKASTSMNNEGLSEGSELPNNIRWCTNQKDQCYERIELKYVVNRNIKEDKKGVVQIAFLIKNGKEESERFMADIGYNIKLAKQVVTSPIKETSIPLGDVKSEPAAVPKLDKAGANMEVVASESSEIVIQKDSSTLRVSSEKENQLWIELYAAHEAENSELVSNISYRYRTDFDRDAQHMEDVYRLSVLYEEDKGKQNEIYKKYLIEFPQGIYVAELSKVVQEVPKAKKNVRVDSELSNWKKTVRTNTLLAYQTYLKKYGRTKAKFQKEANAKLTQFSITETQRIYTDTSHVMEFEISGAEGGEVLIDIVQGSEFVIDTTYRQTIRKLKVQLQRDKIAIIELSIPQSPWKKETIEIDGISPPLKARWANSTTEKTKVLTDVSQGKPPYIIELINVYDGNIEKKYAYNQSQKLWTIKYDTIKNLEAGTYKFRLRDKTKTTAFFSENFLIKQATYSSYWKYGVFLLIFSIFSGLIFSKFRSNDKVTETRTIENVVEPKIEKNNHTSRQQFEKVENIKTVPPVGVAKSNIRDRIKIYGKRVDATEHHLISKELFAERVKSYECFDMQDTWKDSLVNKIYVNESCLKEIDDFVFKKMQEHRLPNGEIPEIGGFLLGCYTKNNDGTYCTALEEFIDVESENSGVYQISFGAKAWSKLELSLESHQKSDFEIMGWFHTHPGHGLFLSSPDLNIYTNFFKAPYQVAMEIDSVKSKRNPSFDVAFFTYKKGGERAVNNAKDLLENWFQWSTVISKFNQDGDVG